MNAYEQILETMRQQGRKDNTPPIQIGIMESADTCAIGKLKLSGSDLLIAEHLKTGYHYAVDNETPSKKDKNTFIGGYNINGDVLQENAVRPHFYRNKFSGLPLRTWSPIHMAAVWWHL